MTWVTLRQDSIPYGEKLMKRFMTLATLALAVALSTVSFAQQQDQPGAQQQQPSQPSTDTSSQASSAQAQPFTGTVVKEGDKYVLQSSGLSYQLDDQDKAKKFEGQQVKVNGDLDKSTRTIRISDIAAAK
jgi:flagellar basal body-associated protein FliL